MKKISRRQFAALFAAGLLSACGAPQQLKPGSSAPAASGAPLGTDYAQPDFTCPDAVSALHQLGLSLLRNRAAEDKNAVLSPYSISIALSMAANGACGSTLSEMEKVIGRPVGQMNSFYADRKAAENDQLVTANALWVRDIPGLNIRAEFLETLRSSYEAEAFSHSFDKTIVQEVNSWINTNTKGLIPAMLSKEPEDDVMTLLVNALSFEAKWETEYNKYALQDGTFHCADGTETTVTLMHSREKHYLKGENATGVMKFYEGRKYAFAALLPNEGTTALQLLESLDGSALKELLDSRREAEVNSAIPAFEADCPSPLVQPLKALGMELPFTDGADFSAMAEKHLVLGSVLHRAVIKVDGLGTKAGAATVVSVYTTAMPSEPPEVFDVILDRPFVYLLVDTENNAPLMMGVVQQLK